MNRPTYWNSSQLWDTWCDSAPKMGLIRWLINPKVIKLHINAYIWAFHIEYVYMSTGSMLILINQVFALPRTSLVLLWTEWVYNIDLILRAFRPFSQSDAFNDVSQGSTFQVKVNSRSDLALNLNNLHFECHFHENKPADILYIQILRIFDSDIVYFDELEHSNQYKYLCVIIKSPTMLLLVRIKWIWRNGV